MLINLENASDVVKLLDIVNVFMTVRDSHKAELETYLDKIDQLETRLDELQARHNLLAEQKRELRQEKAEAQKIIDNLREELYLTIEKNEMLERANCELQDKIKTQQSCGKSVVAKEQHIEALEDAYVKSKKEYAELKTKLTQHQAENELLQASINSSTQEKARLEGIIGKQEGFYQELVSKFNKVKDDLDYTKLISTKLCVVVKRHYPAFTYEQFCAEFDKEAKRIKKFNARANKEKKKWHKIFKTDHGTTHVKRTDQQSS